MLLLIPAASEDATTDAGLTSTKLTTLHEKVKSIARDAFVKSWPTIDVVDEADGMLMTLSAIVVERIFVVARAAVDRRRMR